MTRRSAQLAPIASSMAAPAFTAAAARRRASAPRKRCQGANANVHDMATSRRSAAARRRARATPAHNHATGGGRPRGVVLLTPCSLLQAESLKAALQDARSRPAPFPRSWRHALRRHRMAKKAPEPVHVLRGHTSDVQALAFLPDGRLLAGCALRFAHAAALLAPH